MRKILSLFLAIVFVTFSMVTQGQQLKTYHFFCPGGKEYSPNDLSYTGYEDEMGNITKHGLWTANLTTGKYSINFKQGKLDGNGTIISPTIICNLKYVDDKLVSINYVEKKNGGNIIKYTLNKDGLLVGDFEFRNNSDEAISIYEGSIVKERHYFKHIKGKFDDSGKATGWWEIELTGSNKGVVKDYYEQGYCLGADEKTIELSRAYLIDKKMSELELRNRGYYVINDLPYIKRELEVAIFTAENYMYFMHDFPEGQCMSLKIKNVFNFDNIFNHTYLLGSPISYMSNELYQNIVNQIKSGSSQANTYPKHDANLDKYYVLKADGMSRLYIPLESENEIESVLGILPCPDATTVTDIDENTYRTVQIGNQCWMRENLRTTKYANGTNIPQGDASSPSKIEAFWYYPENQSYNKSNYGLLYNWKAVMGNSTSNNANPGRVQGVCPNGWHVPSDAEWKQLETTIGMTQSDVDNIDGRGDMAVRLCESSGWEQAFYGGCGYMDALWRNSSGFSALPAGDYDSGKKKCIEFGEFAYFWSATEYNDGGAYNRFLHYSHDCIYRGQSYAKTDGYSVRCVKD